MLGAAVFVFEASHFTLRRIQHSPKIVTDAKIDVCASHLWSLLQINQELLLQLVDRHLNLIQQRSCNSVRLLEEGEQKVIVADFLMIVLRSEILRRLQG